MKLSILALALVSVNQIEAISLNTKDFNDGPNKDVGFTRDNYIKDPKPETAKATDHSEYQGVVFGPRSRIVNATAGEKTTTEKAATQ